MTTHQHIASFENKRDGIQANITRNPRGGYIVSVRDLDSGETLPALRIFNAYSDARDYAIHCAAGTTPKDT